MQTELTTAYRTYSLYGAAFLVAHDFPLIDAVRDASGRVQFEIGGDETEIHERLREYRVGTALVNAARFGDALRRLKGLIHGTD